MIFDDTASPIAAGLSYDYAVDVSYSREGVDYSYPPAPAADGFDPDIRFIRIAPTGTFNAPVGADDAEFLLRYVVRVD